MVKSILVPVDLAHREALGEAISRAGDLARAAGAKVTLVGLTSPSATEAAHNPKEFAERLQAYADEVGATLGFPVEASALVDNDVAVDLGRVLVRTAEEMGADLIVMASHVPGFIEHIFSSNAGYVASHAKCSVYVVR